MLQPLGDACSLAAKRLQKEWEDIHTKGIRKIPHCRSIIQHDIFTWVVTFAKIVKGRSKQGKGKGKTKKQGLTIEITFPTNYPFSPPHLICSDFALFLPQFVGDWTPRMTVQSLLAKVLGKLEHVSFPVNHIELGRHSTEDAELDALGLTVVSESTSKVILLCSKPIDRWDKTYWSVAMDKCTELEVGVATLWEGHNLMQYAWSYLEVGVIQQLLLPEGAKHEGRKEKLNSYEYAAEELFSCQAEPFMTNDTISMFYHHDCLSFYRNGTLQYTFTNIFGDGPPSGVGPAADFRPTSATRRGRRARAAEHLDGDFPPRHAGHSPTLARLEDEDATSLASSSISDSPSLGYSDVASKKGEAAIKHPPSSLMYPAISLNCKGDGVTFSFEPPLWTEQVHKFFPNAFTPIVVTCLFALEKRPHRLPRGLSRSVIQFIGTGFSKINIPCWEEEESDDE
eukprot:TRINITY_DN10699_c0_g1_i1.p1 TRINITY_DN10699_c0_g1~~TRINITY_DN10699_c0_g1_i1.p1  ORF type:complete len:453 (-),score=54.11 TRINITY_DN10699_c0_g1_i1:92-1450(-)